MNIETKMAQSTVANNLSRGRLLRAFRLGAITLSALCVLAATAAVSAQSAKHKPKLLLSLPDWCNTPDGMTLDPVTNNIILACPNFNGPMPEGPDEDGNLRPLYPGILMQINPKNRISFFCALPLHSETGRVAPMGIDFGPDGHLYVADNQFFFNKDHKSRLLRVLMKKGKPTGTVEIVADGFNLTNAVIWRGNDIFVSDTFMNLPDDPGLSAVYRLSLKELNAGPVHIKPLGADKAHMVARIKTLENSREDVAGADGMTLDSKGNLYIGNFGDGTVHKLTFGPTGQIIRTVFVNDPQRLTSSDGLFCDLATDTIYAVDMPKNAIRIVTPESKVSTLWENADTDGADGSLDGPAEVLIRDGILYVANFDMAIPGLNNTTYDDAHTISVIQLGK